MTVKTVALASHGAEVDIGNRIFVAAFAVFLHDFPGMRLGADGVRDIAKNKSGDMVVAGLRLGDIFGDQGMRRMAFIASCPFAVARMIPSFVDVIHHMAVVAGGWIISQVSREIRDIQPRPSHCQQGDNTDQDW